jgi:acyl-CoA synthetase (NDP forming)
MGATVVAGLIASGYSGELYIVSRNASEIEGRACVQAIDDLPDGIDLAVLVVGSAAVREAIGACVRRKAHAAVIFASGFSELSDQGRAEQEAIGRIAAEGGIALIGPNCLGFTNHVEGFGIGFATRSAPMRTGEGPAVAMVGQSGALLGHLTHAFTVRNISITYSISTGNEAGLGVQDFIPYLADDPRTRAIVVFAEQLRRPSDFLATVAYSRAQGKPVILMHSCRSARAQEAGRAHTGAIAGNYAVMRTFASHAGAVLVDSLEQLVDAAQILARFPQPPTAGVGIMTVSGAFCGIGLDACDQLGLDVPRLAAPTLATLRGIMPPFVTPSNPLDLTTQVMREPELLAKTADALIADPNVGSVLAVLMPGPTAPQATRFLKGILPAVKNPAKPVVVAMMGDGSFLNEEFTTLIRENGILLSRSPERSLRAIAPVTAYGRWCAAAEQRIPSAAIESLPALPTGMLPEYAVKQYLAQLGIKVPEGALARDVAEAAAIAKRIGYPVVLKAQAAALGHKSDGGGVMLNIADEANLRQSWTRIMENVTGAHPNLMLEGMLVERMMAPGLEMIVGAKRDPNWGPVVLVGLSGPWAEALNDACLFPPDLPEGLILEELDKLKCSKLLHGTRGLAAGDRAAVAHTVSVIGRLMLARPELDEVDINPLVVYPKGEGVVAIDASLVASEYRSEAAAEQGANREAVAT